MIAAVREAGWTVTEDWTQPEGDVCACGHARDEHEPRGGNARHVRINARSFSSTARCLSFNGVGTGIDAELSNEDRKKFTLADLDGILSADVVWLLAANDKGACGSWVELGAAIAGRALADGMDRRPYPLIIVSGPECRRTIFTELADRLFETDDEALAYVRAWRFL